MPRNTDPDEREPNGFELIEARAEQIAARLGIDREELVRQGREGLKIAREQFRKRLAEHRAEAPNLTVQKFFSVLATTLAPHHGKRTTRKPPQT